MQCSRCQQDNSPQARFCMKCGASVMLATDNLAALPADWVYEYFGNSAPASVYDRACLVRSLAELGRFAEAAQRRQAQEHLAIAIAMYREMDMQSWVEEAEAAA